MPLTPGTSLGPYQIDAPLGAGGMGEVYKATDTRLDRTVAIKVLPEHVANDPDLKQRFEREARTVAALNHPHICTLHDIGNQDGIDFLVMEYLDGETLAQRLEKGALPLDQALTIATEIADALDKAHRQGIVHRDLKPGNIMLTKTGAKLLDFGLAKLRKPGTVGATGFSAAATQTEPLTGQGMILGTLQYMAPEQVEGKDADARTDIFAFGAVVYEMVTGQKAFEGDSQASLITSIMSATPTPPSALQPVSPPSLDRVVTKCLAKDPDARWQTARDLRDELTWITDGGSHVGVPAVVATPRKTRERLWMATAALATLVATALAALYLNRAPAEGVTTRLSVLPEPGGMLGLALSPDGTQLAFVTGQLRGQLWVRPVDSLDARPLPGADNAAYPFWSPDGRTIGFFTLDELKTVDLTGGLPRTVCPVPTGAGGTWNQDDVIVFGQLTGSLHQVAAAGGEPIPLTALDVPGAASYLWPQFLSAGERVLFLAVAPEEQESGIYIGSLASGRTPTRVMQTATMARFTAPGYLLFGQDGALMAQSFELERLSVTGDPLRVAEELLPGSVGTQRLRFSTSDQGGLAYVGGGGSAQSQLRWVDRAGTELSTVGAPGDYYSPVLSPDENRIAVERLTATSGSSSSRVGRTSGSPSRQRMTAGRSGRLMVSASCLRRIGTDCSPTSTKNGRPEPARRTCSLRRTSRSFLPGGRRMARSCPTPSSATRSTSGCCRCRQGIANRRAICEHPFRTRRVCPRPTDAGWPIPRMSRGSPACICGARLPPAASGRSRPAKEGIPGGGPTGASCITSSAPTTVSVAVDIEAAGDTARPVPRGGAGPATDVRMFVMVRYAYDPARPRGHVASSSRSPHSDRPSRMILVRQAR